MIEFSQPPKERLLLKVVVNVVLVFLELKFPRWLYFLCHAELRDKSIRVRLSCSMTQWCLRGVEYEKFVKILNKVINDLHIVVKVKRSKLPSCFLVMEVGLNQTDI